jgi:hypothetical protein
MHSTPGASGCTGALGSGWRTLSAIITPLEKVPRAVNASSAPAGAVAVKRARSAAVELRIWNDTRIVSGVAPRRLIVAGITLQAVTLAGGGVAGAAAMVPSNHIASTISTQLNTFVDRYENTTPAEAAARNRWFLGRKEQDSAGACSSAVERPAHNWLRVGSNPTRPNYFLSSADKYARSPVCGL